MKVLFLTHHLRGNDGWSRYAKDLAVGIEKEGCEVLCIVNEISNDSSLRQVALLDGPLAYIANPVRSFVAAIKVQKVLNNFKPDIVHVIVEPYGTILPFLSMGSEKIVITVHSTYAFMPILVSGFRRSISKYLTKWMYTKINLVICVSEYTKQHLLKYMPRFATEKTFVLVGGVNVSVANENAFIDRKNKTKEILFVGALKPRKGLIEAIHALSFVETDFVYRIVGSYNENDSYVKLVKQKIVQFGLGDKVVFEGQVSDERLDSLYKNADLFLMLSINNGADFEGFGLVYIEANARGVPCIGPKDSGVADAIVDGKTGYLVDQHDPRGVAKIIDLFFKNKTIKSRDCISWALKNQNIEKVRQVRSLYVGLVL